MVYYDKCMFSEKLPNVYKLAYLDMDLVRHETSI